MTDCIVAYEPAGTNASRTQNSVGGSELKALRAQLEQQREFRVLQLAELLAPTTQPDPAEATDESLRQVTLALMQAATAVLAEIDGALERIERGRYGRCRRCGVDIPLERLQALPMARLCMPCQARQEVNDAAPRDHHVHRAPVARGRASLPVTDSTATW
jgi:DnaK suppressor protein